MSKKKVLIVTQEMDPYTEVNILARITRELSKHLYDNGMDIRILMPRFGTINERRHRLHEVVRLSGMNIIVDDDDYPLIIKVASLPDCRLQVYFLDNDDFFKKRDLFVNEKREAYPDNADRMIFFCKGALETVRKFGWPPDVVHCHGWMTSLIPMYLKKAYKNEPLFKEVKTIYSAYGSDVDISGYGESFLSKAAINNLDAADLAPYITDGLLNLQSGALSFADATIEVEKPEESTWDARKEQSEKPLLVHEEETYKASYIEFYQALLEEAVTQ